MSCKSYFLGKFWKELWNTRLSHTSMTWYFLGTKLPENKVPIDCKWFNTSMSASMNSQEKVLPLNMQFFLKKMKSFINFFVKKIANQPSCAIFCKQNYIYLSCNFLWQLHILVQFCADLQAISYNLLWTKMKTFLVQCFLTNYKPSNDTFIQVSHASKRPIKLEWQL